MTEDQLSQINRGKMSRILLESLKPELESMKDRAVQKLKNMYRDGTFTESRLLAVTAEICAYDDLEAKLASSARRGESALKKEIDNAE